MRKREGRKSVAVNDFQKNSKHILRMEYYNLFSVPVVHAKLKIIRVKTPNLEFVDNDSKSSLKNTMLVKLVKET